eukprot:362507-Chlamydomonas_euryale.AAC.8
MGVEIAPRRRAIRTFTSGQALYSQPRLILQMTRNVDMPLRTYRRPASRTLGYAGVGDGELRRLAHPSG